MREPSTDKYFWANRFSSVPRRAAPSGRGLFHRLSARKTAISRDRTRVGFAYDIAGKVKIIGVRDGLFIGTVIVTQRPVYRNNLLIPEVKPLYFVRPEPSVNVIEASVMTTTSMNSSLLGEQQVVILDVGTIDGVKNGMIFRNYLKNDPNTEKPDLHEDPDRVPAHGSEAKDRFSIAIIMQSRSVIHPGDLVLSLMDLRDFEKNAGMQTFIQDYDYTVPVGLSRQDGRLSGTGPERGS